MVAKAHARVAQATLVIHKCCLSKNQSILLKALCNLRTTTIRVCCLCMVTLPSEDIAKIESVQRRFTKRLPGLSYVSYSDRLAIWALEVSS